MTQLLNHIVILQVLDVYQIDGRGTVVTGEIKAGWDSARRGDKVVLRAPDGRTIKTAIKDIELFQKGVFKRPSTSGGILLADELTSEQLPTGTEMLKVAAD